MKKSILVLFSLLLMSSLFSSFVAAAPTVGGTVFTKIITLQYFADWGITQASIDPIEGFTRFLLLILLFAILFKGAEMLKLGRNVAITIAIVVSLLTVIFIPGSVLLAVGTSYGTIFSLILLSLPIILGFAGYWLLKDHLWLRAILMGLLIVVIGQVQSHMASWITTTQYKAVMDTVVAWMDYVYYAVWVFFVITVIQAFSSLAKGTEQGEMNVKETAQTIVNWAKKNERRTKTASMNQYIEEEKELKLIDAAIEARDKAVDVTQAILTAKEIKNASERSELVNAVGKVKTALDNAKKEFRRVKGRTWRTERKFSKLVKEFKDKEKDVANLDVLEKQVLAQHEEAIKEIDGLLTTLQGALESAKELGKRTIGTWPANIIPAGPSGAPGSLKTVIENISTKLSALDFKPAENAQKAAIQAVQGIVTEARELMKWKD